MGEPKKIDDLARQMVKLQGLNIRNEDYPQGDIEIIYSGLRPGEKLYEELLLRRIAAYKTSFIINQRKSPT